MSLSSAYLHGEREREGGEGVELDALVAAHLAGDLRLELPVEEVDDDGAVPRQVVLPVLLGHDHVGPVVAVLQLHVGLVLHPVQVLVQPVQQEGQKLLRGVFESSLGYGKSMPIQKYLTYGNH